ncbi:nucleoside-diphosphate kinase [Candidatus Woesearchaeota archaeon CG11_big_fil_rev_8_21_14_0_20_43_8]|nr:MAG: nucleoside-diphosphate kinase [Candidatus Woesearchaeota archaeon CG11_big_fil_rev_8_21_14_0_20_43_8]
MIERTLVLLKPDAVQRCIAGEILTRFERAGLKIVGLKMVWIDKDFSKEHYAAHVDKAFYKGLEEFITLGPVIAICYEGVSAVEVVRKIVGPTEPKTAPPGTIRGDYAHHSYHFTDKKGKAIRNLIHASGNPEEAKVEVALWFKETDLHTYGTVHDGHVL